MSERAAEGPLGTSGRVVGHVGGGIPNGDQTLAARHRRVQYELAVIKLPRAIDRLTAEISGLRANLHDAHVAHPLDGGAE